MSLTLSPDSSWQFFFTRHSQQSSAARYLIQALFAAINRGKLSLNLLEIAGEFSLDELLAACDLDNSTSIFRFETTPLPQVPFIITNSRHVFLRRYYLYQQEFWRWLNTSNQPVTVLKTLSVSSRQIIANSLSTNTTQNKALLRAIQQPWHVISGGAGTGKTYLITQILCCLAKLQVFNSSEQVLIIAPTGKAADHIKNAFEQQLQKLDLADATLISLLQEITQKTATMHKALHMQYAFTPNKKVQLLAQTKLCIIDELSMVSLPLMLQLLRHLPTNCKVIACGDHQQLSAIGQGDLFQLIQQWLQQTKQKKSYYLTILRKNYRTTVDLYQLGKKILASKPAHLLTLLSKLPQSEHIEIRPYKSNVVPMIQRVILPLFNHLIDLLTTEQLSRSSSAVLEVLQQLAKIRILCYFNHGNEGVNQINNLINNHVKHKLNIAKNADFYTGMPLLLTANQAQLKLVNGQTGVVILDEDDRAWFYYQQSSQLQRVMVSHLTAYQLAWAMTVHKAQGSEYNHTILLLPQQLSFSNQDKKLLYTAVTRAKKLLTICYQPAADFVLENNTE